MEILDLRPLGTAGLAARSALELGFQCSVDENVSETLPGGSGLPTISPGLVVVVVLCVGLFIGIFIGTAWALARSQTPVGKILRLAIPERPVLVWATITMLMQTVCSMPLMYTFGIFINVIQDHLKDGGSGAFPVDKIAGLLAFVTVCMVGGTVLGALSNFLFSLAGERITRRLRSDFFRALLVQDMAFFDVHQSGEWLNRLAADAGTVQQAASSNLSLFLDASARFVGGVFICLATSWKLFLVIFVVIPVMATIAISMGRVMKRLSRQYQNSLASAGGIAGETFSSIRTIRTFSNGESKQLDMYVKELDAAFLLGRKRAKVGALLAVSVGLLVQLALMGAVILGGYLVMKGLNNEQGGMQAGTLTSFLLYALWAAGAVGQLIGLYNSMTQAIGASHRVFEVVERAPAIPSTLCEKAETLLRPVICEGSVEFESVSFAYTTQQRSQAAVAPVAVADTFGPPHRRHREAREPLAPAEEIPLEMRVDVLKNLSFKVQPGWVVALVGPSGGGKSTVMSLLMRFYDPRQGTVRLDGHDLKSLDPRWLRKQMGIVAQEPVLFSSSIRDNIAYGTAEAVTDTEIEEAARKANAHNFISKIPGGYHAACGERGVRLSGGEKQRIAIARALLPRPKLLLMDEATSALDAESERLVQDAMDLLLHEDKERPTVMMIAHRLSTVKSAQMILVIKDGQIVERGSHEELTSAEGLYSRLAMHQNLD